MSVSLKQSYDIEYDGTANVARMDLFADTVADLAGLTTVDGITLLQGSTAEDISTGDVYMMKTDGTWVKQPSQSAFANVYTKAEIDSMLYLYYTKTEADALFEWITVTITTDTLPLEFIADGTPLTSVTIKGNGSQSGTPTPSAPITPDFVGTLDDSDWTIPITCASQTTPLYLGEVSTTRRIKRLVLTGDETFTKNNASATDYLYYAGRGALLPSSITKTPIVCSHLQEVASAPTGGNIGISTNNNFNAVYLNFGADAMNAQTSGNTVDGLKEYLASEYAAGHPVTVWYVLASPTEGIVNEPLMKIRDYSDTITTDTPIPTAKGSNELTVDTPIQPSEMTITGKIREVTENEQ